MRLAAAVLLLAAGAARADVRLHPLFSDHAVLQRDAALRVWGWAEPGEEVAVSLGAAAAKATAGADGTWAVTLAAQPASKEPLVLRAKGKNEVVVPDVLLGDVWLCGGQSNMEWPLAACDAPGDVAGADLPLVRHFGVAMTFAATPRDTVAGQWVAATPQTAPGFTAVGFYFARKIHRETGVPVGLLRSCVGGTNIELWMSQDTLLSTPALKTYADVMRASLARYRDDLRAARDRFDAWSARSKEAEAAGRGMPPPPEWPAHPFSDAVQRPRCVMLHNGMIHPLAGFALRGVLWYQGESNAGTPADCDQYIEKQRALVADWRRWFGRDDLPFYAVQLAAWLAPNDDPAGGDGWAEFRDAQRRALQIPGTGLASALDVGDPADIHPKNKADVGERLARWALNDVYGRPQVTSGPLYLSHAVEGSAIRVKFTHVGAGLMAGRKDGRAPAVEDKGAALRRFAIAGEDRKWRWADAVVDGDTVVVRSPDVPRPVALRYAYAMNPAGANLYNRDGLPASPFRTDRW